MTKVERKFEKRKKATKESCLLGLQSYLGDIFKAYTEALEKYNIEIQQTIPEARVRLDGALLMQR